MLKLCLPERDARFLEARSEAALETEEGGDTERMEVVGVGRAEDAELWGVGEGEAIEEREGEWECDELVRVRVEAVDDRDDM